MSLSRPKPKRFFPPILTTSSCEVPKTPALFFQVLWASEAMYVFSPPEVSTSTWGLVLGCKGLDARTMGREARELQVAPPPLRKGMPHFPS